MDAPVCSLPDLREFFYMLKGKDRCLLWITVTVEVTNIKRRLQNYASTGIVCLRLSFHAQIVMQPSFSKENDGFFMPFFKK